MTITEGIIVAVIGLLGSLAVAYFQGRAETRRSHNETQQIVSAMFEQLCKGQQARIEQLQAHINRNEQEIDRLEGLLDEMRADNARLQARIQELEHENAKLRAQLAAMTRGS